MKPSNRKAIICVLLCVLFCAVSAFALTGCTEGGTTAKKYTVVFMDGDTQINEQTVEENKEATVPSAPTKEATDKYTYAFSGWSLTEDGEVVTDFVIKAYTTFYAVYTSTVRKYTVKFMDGGREISSAEAEYDALATKPADPTKEASEKYSYKFAGWSLTENGTVVTDFKVKGNATYYAVYTPTINKYDVKFMLDDEQIGETQNIEYDTVPTMPEEPEKDGDEQYVYVFDGWYTEKTDGTKVTDFTVKGDATYYARFEKTLKKYAVKFIDGDGNQVGETQKVEYEGVPTVPENPTKEGDEHTVYEFAGWYTEETGGEKVKDFTVTKNAVYYAQFTKNVRNYTVRFVGADGSDLGESEVPYGSEIELPEDPAAESGYYFAGWKRDNGKFWQATDVVEKDETLTAAFEVYKGAVIDECVFKEADRSENTDFVKSEEAKAKGFENVYTKSITSDFIPTYSHIDTSYYNVLRFAVKTDALYLFNNFGATEDPRMYMDGYTDWTYWTLTKTADLTWNVKIAFGDEVVFDYTHNACSENSICYMMYHGVSGLGFMIFSYEYDKAYTVECTEVRAGVMPVIDADGVDTSIGCPFYEDVGFVEASGSTAPGYTKKYTKEVTYKFLDKYSYTNISAYSEIRFATRLVGTGVYYQFDNFGPAADARSYSSPFGGWTYWILTQTADNEWNVRVICGETEVFNETHSGCGDNTLSHILWHGTSHGFAAWSNSETDTYTVECTEVRGTLKAEAR